MLQVAATVQSFLAEPADRYIAGNCWLVFHVRQHVAGLIMWGTPAPSDLEALFEIFRGFDSPLGEPLPRYFDVRRLEAAVQPVIANITTFVEGHIAELSRIFTAVAVVHHGGLGHAITEGVRLLAGMRFDWGVFDEPAPALTWLGCSAPQPLTTQIEELSTLAAGGALLVHDLRAFCASHLRTVCVDDAARFLRLSSRTLQRKLAEHETSFKRVLNEARVMRAKQLLSSTTRSVTEIAHDVGCEPRYFATLFRRSTGHSPACWREGARIDALLPPTSQREQ